MRTISLLMIICLSAFSNAGYAQVGYEYSETMQLIYTTMFNGEEIPYVTIPDVEIIAYKFPTDSERKKYETTKRKVEKVYPYYLIAKELVDEMEEEKSNSKKKQFKKYKKARKKELMKEFEKELRDLKVSEGKILVKMINRDTGTSFYELIKEYNSGMKAWAYNVVANKYGYNLKDPYDAEAVDNYYLEMALKAIEAQGGVW